MRDLIDREFDLGDWFEGLFEPAFYERRPKPMSMKTDIKEHEHAYELDIEMPGFEKDEISVTLKNGYLNVSAKKVEKTEKDVKQKNPENCACDDDCDCGCKETEHCECKTPMKWLKKERSFYASRSYYIGEKIEEKDIKAKYQNGVLSLEIPKQKPKEIETHKINID